jgi:hypothetical protein
MRIGEVLAERHSFLTWTIDESKFLASHPVTLPQGKERPVPLGLASELVLILPTKRVISTHAGN